MNRVDKWVRPNILSLKPYSSAKGEFSGTDALFLDANENPFGNYNRYPDPQQRKLKSVLAKQLDVSDNQIFIGNGSDEVIDLLLRVFCEPGEDKIGIFSPTYGMYSVSAAIHDIAVESIDLDANFDLKEVDYTRFLTDTNLKLVFLCSPNNPTGNDLDRTSMLDFIENFRGIVCVDEAYIDFSNQKSLVDLISKFDNLVVSRTMSKAYGLAGARVGFACSNPRIIELLNKVKPPYNVSSLNQEIAIEALEDKTTFEKNITILKSELSRLIEEFENLDLIKKVYPTASNFILAEVKDANKVYNSLVSQKIIVRNRSNQISDCLRFSVGTREENQILLNALKNLNS